jgi:hypothetical protein
MSDPTEVIGGTFVTTEPWLDAIRRAGFRIDFRPGDDALDSEGELAIRLGHPSIADDVDVLVSIRYEHFRLPRDVPASVIERRKARFDRLRALDAPLVMLANEAIVIGWITGGRAAVESGLEAILRERRPDGWSDEYARELAYWKMPGAEVTASLLIWNNGGNTRGHLVAESLLADAYAHVAGGQIRYPGCEPMSAADALTPSALRALDAETTRVIGLLRDIGDDVVQEDCPFRGWEQA